MSKIMGVMTRLGNKFMSPAQVPRQFGWLDERSPARHMGAMLIYKILRADEWQSFQDAKTTLGAPVDLADGYIHFSTATQVMETAAKHFAGADGLVLVAFDPDAMGDALTWEPSRGGALFPHLYRELSLTEVLWHRPLPLGADGHIFPEDLS